MAEDETNIVANGGWIEEKRIYQKKTLRFKILSILWIVPSATSAFIVLDDFPQASGFVETLKRVRIEQWLAFLLLLLQPAFIFLWLRYRKTELPTEETFLVPNATTPPTLNFEVQASKPKLPPHGP